MSASLLSLCLLCVVVVLRVLTGLTPVGEVSWLHNFSPISAIALCGAFYLPRRLAWGLPLAALFCSDLVLNARFNETILSFDMLPRYLALGLICLLGFQLRKAQQARTVALSVGTGMVAMLAASLVGSLGFYLISNSGSWLSNPVYAKTFGGWLQALTTGEPGYPSTLSFYRQTLLSDLSYTALFVGCMALTTKRSEAMAPAALVSES